jgi:hypothetical protein
MSHNTPHTEETKRKIREKCKAYVFTDSHRKNLSKSAIGKHIGWKGKKLSEEHRIKIGIGTKRRYDRIGR